MIKNILARVVKMWRYITCRVIESWDLMFAIYRNTKGFCVVFRKSNILHHSCGNAELNLDRMKCIAYLYRTCGNTVEAPDTVYFVTVPITFSEAETIVELGLNYVVSYPGDDPDHLKAVDYLRLHHVNVTLDRTLKQLEKPNEKA